VADLLDYALGTIAPEERRRIDEHLRGTQCGYCRSWINKAASDPPLAEAAAAAKWQREAAFRELERRLQEVEDS
jgi:hypothetical protein